MASIKKLIWLIPQKQLCMPQFCFQLLLLLSSTLHFVYLRPQRLDLLFLAENNLFQDCDLICLRWDALRCQVLIVLQSITQQLEPLLILSPPWTGHSKLRHKIYPNLSRLTLLFTSLKTQASNKQSDSEIGSFQKLRRSVITSKGPKELMEWGQ